MEWSTILFLGTLVMIVIIVYKYFNPRQREYFSQKAPFILRQDNEKYDTFYLDYYDDLYSTESYSKHDIDIIINTTSPNQNSVFLDIGCGTGHLMEQVEQNGFTIFGVDKSRYMVEACQERVKESEVYCDDVLRDSMLYENNTFSHITCTHFTLYEIENKDKLFRHCFHWLRGGGYLIVHIVDPESYRKVLPSIEIEYSSTISNTSIEYKDYKFVSDYKTNDNISVLTETFTDKYTENVRQNKTKLFMEQKQDILSTAMKCGFIVQSETTYKKFVQDPHQYLVIFVKPMCGDQ